MPHIQTLNPEAPHQSLPLKDAHKAHSLSPLSKDRFLRALPQNLAHRKAHKGPLHKDENKLQHAEAAQQADLPLLPAHDDLPAVRQALSAQEVQGAEEEGGGGDLQERGDPEAEDRAGSLQPQHPQGAEVQGVDLHGAGGAEEVPQVHLEGAAPHHHEGQLRKLELCHLLPPQKHRGNHL